MFTHFLLGVVLLMASQVGVQSGARAVIHDHSTISQGGRIFYEQRIIGANVTTPITLNASEKQTVLGVLTMLKRIVINEDSPGSLTVFFTVARGAGAGNVESQVYLNGVAVGVSWTEDPGLGGVQHSRVIPDDLVTGDTLEVWGRVTVPPTPASVKISLMYLEYSYGIQRLSDRIMNPNLGTDYAVPIAQTSNDP